jgi:hypothetical protein
VHPRFIPYLSSKAQLLQRPLPPRRRVVLAVVLGVGVRRRKLCEVFEAAALGVGGGGDVETGPWVRWGQRGGWGRGEGI